MISLSLLLVYTILGKDKLIRNTVRGDTNRGGGVEIKIIYGVDKRPTNFLVKWSENGVEMPTIKIENF